MAIMTNIDNTSLRSDLDKYKRILVDKLLYIKNSDQEVIPMFILSIERTIDNSITYEVEIYKVKTNIKETHKYVEQSWVDLAVLACEKENTGKYMTYKARKDLRDEIYDYAIMAI